MYFGTIHYIKKNENKEQKEAGKGPIFLKMTIKTKRTLKPVGLIWVNVLANEDVGSPGVDTRNLGVVSSKPGAGYLMDIFHIDLL